MPRWMRRSRRFGFGRGARRQRLPDRPAIIRRNAAVDRDTHATIDDDFSDPRHRRCRDLPGDRRRPRRLVARCTAIAASAGLAAARCIRWLPSRSLSPFCARRRAWRGRVAQADDTVTLNFVNADIEAVVKAVAEITGRNFVVDPRVKGTINIISARPVPKSLVYPTLLSALRLQGFAAVEGDGVVKIVPEADAKQQGGPVARGAGRPPAATGWSRR